METIYLDEDYKSRKSSYTTMLASKYSFRLRNTLERNRRILDYKNYCINCYKSTGYLFKSYQWIDYKVCETCHKKELELLAKYGGKK